MCRHDRVEPERRFLKPPAIILDISHQIDPEIIKGKFVKGHIFVKVLKVKNLFFEAKELFVTVCQFIFYKVLDPIQEVVFSCSRDVYKGHSGLNSVIEPDIIIQIVRRPEIYHLNFIINTADPVDPSETLDNANRIPMDIIIDQIVTVLEILAFGNAVCGNEDVNFSFLKKRGHLISIF